MSGRTSGVIARRTVRCQDQRMKIQNRFTFVLAVWALAGCSAAGDFTMWTTPVELEDAPLREEPRPDTIRFTALDDIAAEHLADSIERWETAGVAVGQLQIVDAGGIHAAMVPDCIPWPDGRCIYGGFSQRGVEVWTDSPQPLDYVWTHEVGHAIGLPHLETGIMWRDNVIDELTLDAVCVLVFCDDWQPEGVTTTASE